MQKSKINAIFKHKKIFKFILYFIILLLIFLSINFLYNKLNNREEIIAPSGTIQTEANTVTLHFAADGRLPYDWYADWIVFDAFIRGVYGTLTYLTPNGLFNEEHEDSLLNSIETENSDPSKLILGIKKGQYFEKNGEKIEFTANDLKFSYSIPFFLKEEDIFEKSDLMKIKGMDKIIPGENYSEEKVTGITILNKYAIKIELQYPDPDIFTYLSTSKYPIVSKYFYQKKKEGELTPGLGKYEFVSSDKNTGEALLKRKIHVEGYPDFVKFIATADKRGDLLWADWWGTLDKPYRKETRLNPAGTLVILFNYDSIFGKNKLFRKAINLAINRKELCESFPYLIPNNQALPNGYWGRTEVEEIQNTELAKKIISGLRNIPNPLLISMGQNKDELKKPYILRLKKQLEEIGLNLVFIPHNTSEPWDTVLGTNAIMVPYKNPVSVFQFFAEGSFYKKYFPKNDAQIASLLHKLNTSYKDTERVYYAKKLSQYLYENNIFIPLWDFADVFYFDEERIETLGNQSGGMLFDIWKVKLKNARK